MPNSKSEVHFILVDFGEGYFVAQQEEKRCDRRKTKSTPSPRPKTGVRQ